MSPLPPGGSSWTQASTAPADHQSIGSDSSSASESDEQFPGATYDEYNELVTYADGTQHPPNVDAHAFALIYGIGPYANMPFSAPLPGTPVRPVSQLNGPTP